MILYVAEAVEPRFRGLLTASGTATVFGGICLQFVIGGVFHWRTVAAISAVVPFLAFNAVFLVPETPYWLHANDRAEAAHRSLQWLRGWVTFDKVEGEFKYIVDAVDCDKAKSRKNQQKSTRTKLEPFTKRPFIAPFSLIVLTFALSHFCGMTSLGTYAVEIFSAYKVPIRAYYATIYLGIAQFVGCILGMALVRAIGKRNLVFISFVGCALCFFTVANKAQYGSNIRHLDSNITEALSSAQNLTLRENVGALGVLEKMENASFNLWMTLILLLGGAIFSHFGARLLPWMLIGEVGLNSNAY